MSSAMVDPSKMSPEMVVRSMTTSAGVSPSPLMSGYDQSLQKSGAIWFKR